MNIKIYCKNKQQIISDLKAGNFSITEKDDADFIITEQDFNNDTILGCQDDGEYRVLNPEDIIYFESYDHDVIAHTENQSLKVREKLYELESKLREKQFIRVHRSYIINRNHITYVKPTYNTKFILTMKNNSKIEVTRSYYYIFKKYIGF